MIEPIEVQRHPRENVKKSILLHYLQKLKELQQDPNATGERKEVADDDIKL